MSTNDNPAGTSGPVRPKSADDIDPRVKTERSSGSNGGGPTENRMAGQSSTATVPGAGASARADGAGRDYDSHKRPWKDDVLGNDNRGVVKNVSWGAIIAGVVTVLAVTVLFSLITAALGLGVPDLTSDQPGEGVGLATGISSIVTLVIALAAGGYVAGVLAGRAGLIHGFLTWATSLLTALVLATVLAGNVLGALGNAVGSTVGTVSDAVVENPEAVPSAEEVPSPNVDADDAQAEAEQAIEEAAPQAEEAADTAAGVAGWTFAGLLIGSVISAAAGLLGSRSVVRRHQDSGDTNRKVRV